jgi:hypothetical protein
MEDKKEYKFKCGITAAQEICDIAQGRKLIQIIKKLDIGEIKDFYNISLLDLIEKIISSEILPEFLDTILIVKHIPDNVNYENLKLPELYEVIQDFFALSQWLTELLETGKSKAAL